MGKGQK